MNNFLTCCDFYVRYIEVFRSTNDEMLRVQRRSGGVSGYFPNRGGGNGGRYDGGTDDGYQAPSKPYSLLDMPFFNDSRFDGGYNNGKTNEQSFSILVQPTLTSPNNSAASAPGR